MPLNNDIRTLVIGGYGLIGSRLVPLLVQSGRKTTILDVHQEPPRKLPPDTNYISGDYGSPGLIAKLLEENDEIIHLAYSTTPNTSFNSPDADITENLIPSVRLLSIAASKQCRVLFLSSGGTVYGEAQHLPLSENHPRCPVSPYGITKLTLERYAFFFSLSQGLDFMCIRPSNVFGPGQYPFKGQGFIATAIASCIQHIPVKIFGKNGTIRDYIYIDDVADGILAAADNWRSGETYNLGSGTGRSNMDVIEAIKPLVEEMGGSVAVENLPERAFDVKSNILDSRKIMEQTNWTPTTDFHQGLATTRDWLIKIL